MTDTVKVVSTNTVIKKIILGVPVPQIAQIEVVSDIGQLANVAGNGAVHGDVLVFNATSQQFQPQLLFDRQTIDAGEGFWSA